MTMTAPSDIRAMSALPDGCGIAHEAPALEPGERWALDCPPCEAVLAGRMAKYGWSSQSDSVALTCDERRLLETEAKEGSAATSLLVKELGATLAAALRGAPLAAAAPAAVPSPEQLVSALQGLPQDQLAALLKSAGLAPAEVSADTAGDAEAEAVVETKPARKRVARKPAAPVDSEDE